MRLPARLVLVALIALGAPTAGAAEDASLSDRLADGARKTVARVWTGAQDVAMYALGMLGVDYRWGGTHPDSGFDCSGLVQYVFQQVTGVSLPRTSQEMSRIGEPVAVEDLRAGDLVFFNTRRMRFSHVGIYLGDNRFVHAPNSGRTVEVVRLSESYWQRKFNGARRLVDSLPLVVPPASAATLGTGDEEHLATPGPARSDTP